MSESLFSHVNSFIPEAPVDDEIIQQQFIAFWSLTQIVLTALHQEGVLPIQSVVNRVGERLDSDSTTFREPMNPFLKEMYDGLLSLEEVLPPFNTSKR